MTEKRDIVESGVDLGALWERWAGDNHPIPPCPLCGGEPEYAEWEQWEDESGPVAACDHTACGCGLRISGYAVCADATKMSGFRWWFLARTVARLRTLNAELVEALKLADDVLSVDNPGEYLPADLRQARRVVGAALSHTKE